MNENLESYVEGYEYRKNEDGSYSLWNFSENYPVAFAPSKLIIDERRERLKRVDAENAKR